MRVLPNPHPTREYEILLYADVTCRCPVNDKQDRARVDVKYVPDQLLIEYENFRLFLDAAADVPMTHEALTHDVLDAIVASAAPRRVEVTTVWHAIEGVGVTVRAKWEPRPSCT